MDRKYILTSLSYAVLGLSLGIYMAASQNHEQHVTHAHIMLVGFVVSFIYALLHKLWLNNIHSRLANIQFYLHQLGSFVLFIGLFLLYGEFIALDTIEPVLAFASILVFIGMITMLMIYLKSKNT
ncbi:MAG: TonB-dependent receptor [Gammaproteobacteria bacterium]|nr:TonB-dependent receptor [Gammaproteobacteria bacterium]